LFYGCFIVVLWLYYRKTGKKWVQNGYKMRSEEFDRIVFLKNHQKEVGFVKRRGSKKQGGGVKMTRSIFYKIKILFSNFKKNKPFFLCL